MRRIPQDRAIGRSDGRWQLARSYKIRRVGSRLRRHLKPNMAHGPRDNGGNDDVNGNHASAEDYGDEDGGDGDDDGL